PAITVLYTLSLHDALPILLTSGYSAQSNHRPLGRARGLHNRAARAYRWHANDLRDPRDVVMETMDGRVDSPELEQLYADFEAQRSEEHTSELQSRENLVCR